MFLLSTEQIDAYCFSLANSIANPSIIGSVYFTILLGLLRSADAFYNGSEPAASFRLLFGCVCYKSP
jgi:hypothetical protein